MFATIYSTERNVVTTHNETLIRFLIREHFHLSHVDNRYSSPALKDNNSLDPALLSSSSLYH